MKLTTIWMLFDFYLAMVVSAAGGIDQILRGKRSCKPANKWRKPLEDAGIKFDEKGKELLKKPQFKDVPFQQIFASRRK